MKIWNKLVHEYLLKMKNKPQKNSLHTNKKTQK